jgi:hypothetical protein
MTRQTAINEVWVLLRKHLPVTEAAARLYAIGVTLDEIEVAARAAGEPL